MGTEREIAFDPYRKWLGIPKTQGPPTFYQLLGLTPGESDTEVIEEAAIRQTTHLRAYQVGPHADDCTRLLNEISAARQVLVNPQKRARIQRQAGSRWRQSRAAAQEGDGGTNAAAVAAPVVVESTFADLDRDLPVLHAQAPAATTCAIRRARRPN